MRRRRGYRRRRSKKPMIIVGVILGIIVLLAVLLLAVRIREVTVTGNRHYTAEQIEDLIFEDKMSRNSALCYYESNFREHRSFPFIEEYKINFKSPTKVEIVVFEKSVTGYVSYMSSYMYFDKDGIIVESSDQQLPGVPWIEGLDFGHIVLYQPLPVEKQDVFDKILNLTQILSVNEIPVDKISYNSYLEAELFIGDIVVKLGDSENMNGKVAELKDILPELSGLSGTLYLETYDETNENPTYTFKKK